jgi:hypothetical protein
LDTYTVYVGCGKKRIAWDRLGAEPCNNIMQYGTNPIPVLFRMSQKEIFCCYSPNALATYQQRLIEAR